MQIQTIQVPIIDANMIQSWLDSGVQIPDAGEIETVKIYTTMFAGDVEADIKVCNSDDGPYIDAVWFDDGIEIGFLEVRDTLLGEYVFTDKYDGAEYKVIVEKSA